MTRVLTLLITTLFGVGLALTLPAGRASAGPPDQGTVENSFCLACHGNPDLRITLPNGDSQSLYVDITRFESSIHGLERHRCVDCHKDITGYPHPTLVAGDRRDYALRLYPLCRNCHQEQYDKSLDSMHARALAGGLREAAICTDCHSPHYTEKPASSHAKISQTCAQCHSTIFNEYKESVHGAALFQENNNDVPTCISCHGVHNIQDPTTAVFRLQSPELCGKCHADRQLMSKYGLSTNVFQSYVADFHGTTITLFERRSPNQPSNKAVCFDCHGIHDIKSTKDPQSSVVRANLLKTCQKCHPDADANFPASWTSHYEPSRTKYPLVYFVDLFYRLIIPGTIGFIAMFLGLDATRRVVDRTRRRGH